MYWKCSVCGYVHTESDPPEKCPVCGADKSRFIAVDADGQPIESAAANAAANSTPPAPSDTGPAQRQWKCTVCGYIHTGDAPPEKCPVCGADRSRFIEVDASGEPLGEPAVEKFKPADPSGAAPQRRWKCTVCGYIHTGPEPPEKCPACGADRSLFVEVAPEGGDKTPEPPEEVPVPAAPPTRAQRYYQTLSDLMVKQHAHPISVHIPNGVAPVGILFLFLSVLFHSPTLEIAGTYNLVVVLLAMPFVLFSGVNDWKKRFGGNLTTIFLTKMVCGGIISALLIVLLLWRALDPSILTTPGAMRSLYLFLNGVLIAAAALAGYMGGKLVFPTR